MISSTTQINTKLSTPLDTEFARALLRGLQAEEKSIPCRFLYDQRGSALFEEITRLPEYYPTRTETAILEACVPAISEHVPPDSLLIEFGSGSSRKTEILLNSIQHHLATYVALDVSQDALEAAQARLRRRFPKLQTRMVCANFHHSVDLPLDLEHHERIGFFPGSTIGNCSRTEAIELLSSMRTTLKLGARLIIGTDLVKPLEVLLPAYDDSAGVTAEFNLNILLHANKAVGTDFDIDLFEHCIEWNEELERVEIYLVSRVNQVVDVLNHSVRIAKGERIHTEDSHKYTLESFTTLAREAGWHGERVWTDDQQYFAVHELVAK